MIHGAGVVHSITGLASDGSGLIAVRPGPGGGGVAYFSPNGHSWQYSATLGAAGGFSPQAAKGSAYGFVVTGTGPACRQPADRCRQRAYPPVPAEPCSKQ